MDGTLAEPRRISLFRTYGAYVLGLAWITVLFALIYLGKPGLRTPVAHARWIAFATLAAVPLCALAYGFWVNRAGFRRWSLAARWSAGSKLVLEFLGWVLLWFVVAIVVAIPPYADYTDRAKASEMVLLLSAARAAATDNVGRSGTLAGSGQGVELGQSKWVDVSVAGTDGVAIAYSASLGVLALLQPRLEGQSLTWSCEVYPLRAAPASCRDGLRSTTLDRDAPGSPAEHARELHATALALQATPTALSRRLAPGGVMDVGYRDADGTIALYSDRHGVLLIMKGDACTVHPAQAVVPGCTAGAQRKP